MSWSLGLLVLVLVLVLGGQVLVLVLGGQVLVNIPGLRTYMYAYEMLATSNWSTILPFAISYLQNSIPGFKYISSFWTLRETLPKSKLDKT